MSTRKKTIQINPLFFSRRRPKKSKTRKKKQKKMSYELKPNDVKKQLMSRIKEYQQKKKILNDENEDVESNNDNFQKNFSDHMTYLNSVIKENKIKKRRKKEKKINKEMSAEIQPLSHQQQPPIQEGIDIKPMETTNNNIVTNNKTSIIIHGSKNPPPYGCLKNSNKPTYRQWQKSLKEKLTPQPHFVSPIVNVSPIIAPIQNKPNPILIRQEKLKDIKNKNKKMKKVKIRKTTFKLGKHNGRVSVLVKNRRTRKKLKKECNLLKKKSLPDIKEYLRQHNLIKIGTAAPEKVLRQIYENAYLSGDVFNNNPDNLIHNYMQN